MSCCGQKRRALASTGPADERETNQIEVDGSPALPSHGSRPVIFRYVGNGYVQINGKFGRRIYRFSTSDRELEVMAEDVPIMHAYANLIEVK